MINDWDSRVDPGRPLADDLHVNWLTRWRRNEMRNEIGGLIPGP